MSSKEWFFRIRDILKAIDKIDQYLDNMTLTSFRKNEMAIDAVIRNFEIIGEASKHIPLSVRHDNLEIPWAQMTSMRNALIHEYFGVDVDTVWYTAKKHLPALKKQLEAIRE